MLQVAFFNRREIRMGSPYNVCGIRLYGSWVPELPEADWQDIRAYRPDRKVVALVRWDVPGNVPGFRLWILDTIDEMVETSERFPGCCTSLEWKSEEEIVWKAFPDLEGTHRRKKPV